MLAVGCCALTVTTRKSGTPHPVEGFWLFASRGFGAVETVGVYYGTPIYSSLVNKKQKGMAYGGGIMSVTS